MWTCYECDKIIAQPKHTVRIPNSMHATGWIPIASAPHRQLPALKLPSRTSAPGYGYSHRVTAEMRLLGLASVLEHLVNSAQTSMDWLDYKQQLMLGFRVMLGSGNGEQMSVVVINGGKCQGGGKCPKFTACRRPCKSNILHGLPGSISYTGISHHWEEPNFVVVDYHQFYAGDWEIVKISW